jgi:predicted metal-dependent phosphoesterase TrpH
MNETGFLKCCLHAHSREYPDRYDTEALLHAAANHGYDVLAITEHNEVYFPEGIEEVEPGLLLVPGIEASVGEDGTHVLVLNTLSYPTEKIKDMADFRSWVEGDAGPDTLVVAPHPFYGRDLCLGGLLEENIDLFDVIEFSHLTYPVLFNVPNLRAVRLARKYDKPMIGSADVHRLWQLGTTYSMIKSEKNAASLLRTIKESGFSDCKIEPYSQDGFGGNIAVKTRYLTPNELACVVKDTAKAMLSGLLQK